MESLVALLQTAWEWLYAHLPYPAPGTEWYRELQAKARREYNQERAKPPEERDCAKLQAAYEEMLLLDAGACEVITRGSSGGLS
jgi:hypothetical protein